MVVVCLIAFIQYYHRPSQWMDPSWRPHHVPIQQLFHAALFLAIPLATWPLLRSPNRLGLRLGHARTWLIDVAVAYAVILTVILIVGRSDTFARFYPLYRPAANAWQTFLWYQLIHLTYMFAWEFLFRGYMLQATAPEIGKPAAVVLQCLPFAILHIGKPELESFGAIAAGLYLGILALRANSFLPCAILHFAAACTMDLYATLLRTPAP